MARLSEKQERFCMEYLIDFHVTNAAIRAGYSVKAASTLGSKLVKNGKISARIAELRATASAKTGISLERTLDQLGAMAFADPAEMYDVDGNLKSVKDMPAHFRRAIVGIDIEENIDPLTGEVISKTKKVKLAPKDKATDMIMKHLGEYKKDNAQKQTQVTVIVDIVDDEDPDQGTAEPDEVEDDELDRLDQEGEIPDDLDDDI